MMVGTARVFMLVAEIMFQKLLNIPCIKAGQDIKNKNKKNMNLIKLKQLDQTELTTFIGTVNDPLYITNPSGYLTFASGVMMTTGNQMISGNKTFSGILFGSGGWSFLVHKLDWAPWFFGERPGFSAGTAPQLKTILRASSTLIGASSTKELG